MGKRYLIKLPKPGIIYILILIFSSLIGLNTPTGFCLGDKIFMLVGIAPWSNGQSGTHYPGILALCLLVIGMVGVKKEFSGKVLLTLLILGAVFSPMVASLGKVIYYKAHSGIWAIDYDPRNSQINFTTNKNALEFSGQLTLANYGSSPVSFGIKMLTNGSRGGPQDGIPTKEVALKGVNGTKDSESFTLEPGETQCIAVHTAVTSAKSCGPGGGTFNGPDLILFTDKGTRTVGVNR